MVTMTRASLRLLAVGLVIAAALAAGPGPAAARGDDVCPEPNDGQQGACYLGPHAQALGFISRPDDVDIYRVEVLDFDVDVRVELADKPRPYTVELLGWDGDVLASSPPTDGTAAGSSDVVTANVRLPGAYYIRVRSPTGAFDDLHPYLIFRELTYSGASIPQVLYSSEFRAGESTGFAGSTDLAEHSEHEGRYAIAMRSGGTPAEPAVAWATWGPLLTDFVLTVDARVVSGPEAGFQVFFRRVDTSNTYVVTVDARAGRVMLSRWANDVATGTGWVSSASINTSGGINRCVVRAVGDDLRVHVNGAELIRHTDPTFATGRFGFGAITWGDPPVIQFDNALVTTPGTG